jgi:hypothetical protein
MLEQQRRNGNVTSIYIYLSNVKFNSRPAASAANAPGRAAVRIAAAATFEG